MTNFLDLLKSTGYTSLLVQLTGEPGTGKTRMAMNTGAKIDEMAILNADAKRAIINQILSSGAEFGYYKDVIKETEGMKELGVFDFYSSCIEEISQLPPERRRVLIFDPWEFFENTLKPHVESNSKKYKDFWSPMGTFKGAQQWQVSHELSARILSKCMGLAEIVILTSHLRNAYRGGVQVPGKFKPDNKVTIVQKTDLRLWLRPNIIATPVALVMKTGLMKATVTDGVLKEENVLPRKLTPFPDKGDREIWDIIARYWEEPFGTREPREYEKPNEFEVSILEGTLTKEQAYAWEQACKIATMEELELEAEMDEMAGRAREMKEKENKSYPIIAKELGIPIPQVIELLKKE